jgi:hydroxyethylthiazole kinase
MTASEIDLPVALEAVSTTQPLIEAVTNPVTVNGVANAILHGGALPVMADTRREVAEMVATTEGCLLNTGDVSERGEETMLAAGRAANESGVPIVLDPVGMSATPTRTAVVEELVEDLDIAVINGNHAGPASYEVAFWDAIAGFDAAILPEGATEARIERVGPSN